MRWLLASEVAFLKAEFKLLKGDKSGAKSDYEEGIRLSFLENGLSASDAADYAQSMKTPARFIDMSENPTKYSKNALGTVSVKWAEDGNELERIITQSGSPSTLMGWRHGPSSVARVSRNFSRLTKIATIRRLTK